MGVQDFFPQKTDATPIIYGYIEPNNPELRGLINVRSDGTSFLDHPVHDKLEQYGHKRLRDLQERRPNGYGAP